MQRQDTSTLRTRIQDRRPWLMTACTVAFVVAAGVGVWRTVDHREGTTTTTVDQPVAVSTAAPAARDAFARQSGADSLTVYLVGSEDEAAHLTDALRAGDQILGTLGQPTFAAQVVVVASAEEGEFIARANADADAIRMQEGLPPITVIDLRPR
jgi:hypothetical protein